MNRYSEQSPWSKRSFRNRLTLALTLAAESLAAAFVFGWLLHKWTKDPLAWVAVGLACTSLLFFLGLMVWDPGWFAKNKRKVSLAVGIALPVIMVLWAAVASFTKS